MAQGTIPIKPDWVSCLISVTSSTTKKKLVASVSFLLFPLTCAWALICHRFQGQTVDHLCLHAHQSSPHRAMIVNKQYYYVALSRVRTLLGLSMTELLEADPEYYTLTPACLCMTPTWLCRHYRLGCGMLRPGACLPVRSLRSFWWLKVCMAR